MLKEKPFTEYEYRCSVTQDPIIREDPDSFAQEQF